MAIFGVGAHYDGTTDMSGEFIRQRVVGVGWDSSDAPELHQLIRTLKIGDLVYIKAYPPRGPDLIVKAIGLVAGEDVLDASATGGLVEAGRRVVWLSTEQFRIPKPKEKLNVRTNTAYEEFHHDIQQAILKKCAEAVQKAVRLDD
jgi:hypothetical protein